jgi:hypothetical protein
MGPSPRTQAGFRPEYAPASIAGGAHSATVSNPLPICTRLRVLIKGKRT